jgi:predicted transcriptional regulator
MNGAALRQGRRNADLLQADIATWARCSRSRIAQIEGTASVPTPWALRYLDALDEASKARSREPDNKADVTGLEPETTREVGVGPAILS